MEVSVAGQEDIFVFFTEFDESVKNSLYGLNDFLEFGAGEEPNSRYNLIVAAAGGVYAFAGVAETFGEHKFYLRVYVLHVGRNLKFAVHSNSVDFAEFLLEFVVVVLAEKSTFRKHLRVSHTAKCIIFSKIQIHFAVSADRKTCYKFRGVKTFVPKFHNVFVFLLFGAKVRNNFLLSKAKN